METHPWMELLARGQKRVDVPGRHQRPWYIVILVLAVVPPLYFRVSLGRVLERWQSPRTASVSQYRTARLFRQLLKSRTTSQKLAPRHGPLHEATRPPEIKHARKVVRLLPIMRKLHRPRRDGSAKPKCREGSVARHRAVFLQVSRAVFRWKREASNDKAWP